jgi:hypothetical protein
VAVSAVVFGGFATVAQGSQADPGAAAVPAPPGCPVQGQPIADGQLSANGLTEATIPSSWTKTFVIGAVSCHYDNEGLASVQLRLWTATESPKADPFGVVLIGRPSSSVSTLTNSTLSLQNLMREHGLATFEPTVVQLGEHSVAAMPSAHHSDLHDAGPRVSLSELEWRK